MNRNFEGALSPRKPPLLVVVKLQNGPNEDLDPGFRPWLPLLRLTLDHLGGSNMYVQPILRLLQAVSTRRMFHKSLQVFGTQNRSTVGPKYFPY